MYQYVYTFVYIFNVLFLSYHLSRDIKAFQQFIGEATVTFGYIQSLSFALKRAVNKVLDCMDWIVLYC